ncbi:MAG: hypothetical protein FWG88_11360 [Oscillospiraceae bacterium]|nr:hypothetical protein [Oscillospiraceae bacterium]
MQKNTTVKPNPKPRLSERNSIIWTDKDLMFMQENSIDYPKPPWMLTHTKKSILIIFVKALLCLIADIARSHMSRLIFLNVATIFITMSIIDFVVSIKRANKFISKLIDQGGQLADSWNGEIIKRERYLPYISLAISSMCYYGFIIIAIKMAVNAHMGVDISGSFLSMGTVYGLSSVIFFCYNIHSSPCIFMDLDIGMYFGGAIFSYDIMSGIHSTGSGNRFELYHEGKKVATGKMLPEDMNYLRSIIEIRSKYKNVV